MRARAGLKAVPHFASKVIPALMAPWQSETSVFAELRKELRTEAEALASDRKKSNIREWRKRLEDAASSGAKEAFRHLRADDATKVEDQGLSVGEVLHKHRQLWGELWKALPESPPEQEDRDAFE